MDRVFIPSLKLIDQVVFLLQYRNKTHTHRHTSSQTQQDAVPTPTWVTTRSNIWRAVTCLTAKGQPDYIRNRKPTDGTVITQVMIGNYTQHSSSVRRNTDSKYSLRRSLRGRRGHNSRRRRRRRAGRRIKAMRRSGPGK